MSHRAVVAGTILAPRLAACPRRWSLPNAEHYALQYADGRQTYITESVSGHLPARTPAPTPAPVTPHAPLTASLSPRRTVGRLRTGASCG